ncbi:PREDICTED: putative pentatricopeptide repeat-containing protein At5g52630 [Fragaria vesca subsp. vesca]|uniref:putative pentatricopeptide repeat-containing protein At5g52630 n=1 Tax=Fragaria vesca subsp. vesca TaxID=101020 RepID=UPI0002C302BA|nr:PREDICTED: putative pentatricopeptide repeat-containing protein At5g52630 [Fragaria vesca subsp. vesca]
MRSRFKLIFSSSYSAYAYASASSSSIKVTNFNQSQAKVHNFLSLLQRFSKTLIWVNSIHAQIITNGLFRDQSLVRNLVGVYCDLGSLVYARQVFDECPHPKTILYNSMIYGYLRKERYNEAHELFRLMGFRNVEVDSYTCNYALKACMRLSDYETGVEVIKRAVDRGVESNGFFGSSMINFLMKFGNVDEARRCFDRMGERDVVCWNSMIGGYVQAAQFSKAFDLFHEMWSCGIRPSAVSMLSMIRVCIDTADFKLAKCVHGSIVGLGMSNEVLVLTSLVDMYSNIGDMRSACWVFETMPKRNLVSWNVMVSGCVQNGMVHESFAFFDRLVASGVRFDSGTMVSLIQGCSQIAALNGGKILHGCSLRRGFELNPILSTAIVDLYSKCGAVKKATFVFDRMKQRNVITWTAMLVGLTQNGHAEEALKLFSQMQKEGVAATSVTLVSLVHSCAHLGSLKKGKGVHAHFIRQGYSFDVVNMTALIDMYAKCGTIEYAERIFNKGSIYRDVILWNSMITSYGIHGHGQQALDMYKKMMEEGFEPNETSVLSLLTACSHSGLLEEGIEFFHSMERNRTIRLIEKHYASFVDLLSRAGRFKEAEALIEQMPFKPGSSVFEALLSGCQAHKNIGLGIKTADKLLCIESMNPSIYVVLSNIYAQARRWDDVSYIRNLMRTRGLRKTPGYSLIEVENQVHTFFAGDNSHPHWAEIYQHLENIRAAVEASGYIPDTSSVLRNVDEPMKIRLLWGHSERLAIAFGLLSTPAGSLIRITKNLRVCVDCHNVTKLVSKMMKRELIVRDANRFHRFVNGKCSCNDYW